MKYKNIESIGFTLILVGSVTLYFGMAFTLTRWLDEIYACNIMAVATLVVGIVLYKIGKRKEGEK